MYYVYAIESQQREQWLYIGYTDDLQNRFVQHNKGIVRSTKAYRPFRLVYYEAYQSEVDARRREQEIKLKSQEKEILKRRIKNSLDAREAR